MPVPPIVPPTKPMDLTQICAIAQWTKSAVRTLAPPTVNACLLAQLTLTMVPMLMDVSALMMMSVSQATASVGLAPSSSLGGDI